MQDTAERKVIREGLSVYLDLMRCAAALIVVLYHAGQPRASGGWINTPYIGGDAVMIFFVLSGLVIAYSVDRRDVTLGGYMADRLARLWSVLVPAMVLTIVLDYVGLKLFPAAYDHFFEPNVIQWNNPVVSVGAALSFLNEIWFTSIPPLSNGPVWSLSYEFWYYMLFGACFFLTGVQRWIGVLLCMLIAGPKILLLWPVWLVGVAVYAWLKKYPNVSARTGWLLFVLPLAFHAVTRLTHPFERTVAFENSIFGDAFVESLDSSKHFLYCYVIGATIALHFIGAAAIQDHLERILRPVSKLIKAAASSTLSIYLFHFPILLFVSSAFVNMPSGPVRTAICLAITLVACFALGAIFERTRFAWRRRLRALLERPPLMILGPNGRAS